MNWDKVWYDFDTWYQQRTKRARCSECEQTIFDDPEWDEQQKMIENAVEAQLRKKKGKPNSRRSP